LVAVQDGGFSSIEDYLESVDAAYDDLVRTRIPEEILLEL